MEARFLVATLGKDTRLASEYALGGCRKKFVPRQDRLECSRFVIADDNTQSP